ncbi:MAG: hypothetical protein HPY81_10285 [Firmicutes bacterium]|nr:hypothetical protein [Bacillota bacterium]
MDPNNRKLVNKRSKPAPLTPGSSWPLQGFVSDIGSIEALAQPDGLPRLASLEVRYSPPSF